MPLPADGIGQAGAAAASLAIAAADRAGLPARCPQAHVQVHLPGGESGAQCHFAAAVAPPYGRLGTAKSTPATAGSPRARPRRTQRGKGGTVGLTVGGCQLASATGAVAENLERIEQVVWAAKESAPDLALLAFPELAVTGYCCGPAFHDLAVRWPDGGFLPRLSRLAGEAGVALVVGFAEAGPAYGVVADSAAVFARDGRPLGVYRKAHCLDRERRYFVNGDGLPLFEVDGLRFGIAICWDLAMPELARSYALDGADFMVAIGAWEDPYGDDWELAVAARAFDNVMPLLAVNRTGHEVERGDDTENAVTFPGRSLLVDCLGKPLARLDDGEDAVLVGTVDPEHTRAVRRGYGSQLRDRRPDLYGRLIRPHLHLEEP